MLNKGVTPVVCQKGSVGASGDLAAMSQIALLLMGEGEAYYKGESLPGKTAMERAGIPIPGLKARDGLATINGSNLITAMSALHLFDINANMKPYDVRLHQARGFPGAVRSAQAIMKCIESSDLLTKTFKIRVQDAYSMRSSPQVIGAAHDAVAYARKQVEIELNGVCDNPVFLPEHNLTLTGANFQGTPVSLPMDMINAALTMVCVLSERRFNRLNNPALSIGLPAFLTKGAGMMSGLMLSQYAACTLITEQRILSAPASVMSIPAAADQEDFVSMAMNTAIQNAQILDNAYGILGIEFMAASQALDFREFTPGKGVSAAKQIVRKHVAHLDEDRPLYNDHNTMKALVKSCEILEGVEKTVGSLG
jgi:histidine ammonia-lyase